MNRLAELAPTFDSRQPQWHSLAVRASLTVPDAGTFRFRCWYQQPDRRACYVSTYGVPIFVAIGQHIFVYEPLEGPFLLHADWFFHVGSAMEWGPLNLGSARTGMVIDLKPLLEVARERGVVTRLGGRRFRLEAQSVKGARFQARLDLDKVLPYSWFKIDAQGVVIEMETLTANEPAPQGVFQWPPFQSRLNLTPEPIKLDRMGSIFERTARFILLPALRSPSLRATIESKMSAPVDWDQLEQRHLAVAPVLKALIAPIEQLP